MRLYKINIFIILIIVILTSFNFPSEERKLQQLLNSQIHTNLYQPGIFDCSEMVGETATLLNSHGYKTKIAYSDWKAAPSTGHVWVIVYIDEKPINVGTVSDHNMGCITYHKDYNDIDKIFENEKEMRDYGII